MAEENTQRKVNPGYNRYQQIMDSYASYKPGEGEADIKYGKMAMAGNLTENSLIEVASSKFIKVVCKCQNFSCSFFCFFSATNTTMWRS